MRAVSYCISLVLMLVSVGAKAQMKLIENTQAPLASAQQKGVVIHADPRIAILLKKYRNVQLGVIRSGRGFRVQIYNGNDRNKANKIRVDFMRRYPNVRTYLTYVQPQFRVKVGDFESRGEAYKFYAEVSNIYDPSMIVPDIIVINTLKDD